MLTDGSMFLDRDPSYDDGLSDVVRIHSVGLALLKVALGRAETKAQEVVARCRQRQSSGALRRFPTCQRQVRTFANPGTNVELARARSETLKTYADAQAKVASVFLLKQKVGHSLAARHGEGDSLRAFREFMEKEFPMAPILDADHSDTVWKQIESESLKCKKVFETLVRQRRTGSEEQLKFAREELEQFLKDWDLPARNKKWKDAGRFLEKACSPAWDNVAHEFDPTIVSLVKDVRKELQDIADVFWLLSDGIENDINFLLDLRGSDNS